MWRNNAYYEEEVIMEDEFAEFDNLVHSQEEAWEFDTEDMANYAWIETQDEWQQVQKKEKANSTVLDPHGNMKDEFLIKATWKYWDYLKSDITWANFKAEVELTDEKCPECRSIMMKKDNGDWTQWIFCSSSRVVSWNKAGISKCKNDWLVNNDKETWIECPDCKKWTIIEKESAKWIRQVCSDPKCEFFNWLWKIEKTDKKCPECWWTIIIKTVWAKQSKREDCINKMWSPAKGNFWCDYEGEWI